MTPPDSDEREVCGAFDLLQCMKPPHGFGPHSYRVPQTAHAIIPLSLAQRILAALEEAYGFVPMAGKELQALAAELRSNLPKEPK